MDCPVCDVAALGFGAASALLGAVALGCLLTAVGFTLQGFRGRPATWHSRAVVAALAGLGAVVTALVLALAGL